MGGPAAALRSLVGWIMVIGLEVYTIQHPDQVMQAVADVIEAVAERTHDTGLTGAGSQGCRQG